jgi:hypothetical protein
MNVSEASAMIPERKKSVGHAGAAKVIITRFNVYIKRFREMAGLTEENYLAWCNHRAEVFLSLTLPSILDQAKEVPFNLIIYFDTESLEPVERVVRELSSHDFIHPKFIDMRRKSIDPHFLGQVSDDIFLHTSVRSSYVVSTRMDTDDMLAPDFMLNLNKALHQIPEDDFVQPWAISLPLGSQWNGSEFRLLSYERNPFLSLVEKRKSTLLKTIYGFAHYDVLSHARLHSLLTQHPAWLQVIHDRNAANQLNNSLPKLDYDQMIEFFRINPKLAPKIFGE